MKYKIWNMSKKSLWRKLSRALFMWCLNYDSFDYCDCFLIFYTFKYLNLMILKHRTGVLRYWGRWWLVKKYEVWVMKYELEEPLKKIFKVSFYKGAELWFFWLLWLFFDFLYFFNILNLMILKHRTGVLR